MPDSIQVALICGEGESGRLLREVVRGIGRPIVHDAPVAAFEPAALALSGANVVVVDLIPEGDFDAIHDLLDDDRYRVIFNDSEVSSRLSGWEHARWARHLAAKILGIPAVVDPPRPDDVAASQAAGNAGGESFVPPPLRQQPATVTDEQDAQRGNELGIDDWLSRVMAVEDPTRRFAHGDPAEPDPAAVTAATESAGPARRSSDGPAVAVVAQPAAADDQVIDALMLSAITEMNKEMVVERGSETLASSPGNDDWNLDELMANIDEWLPPTPVAATGNVLNAAGQPPDASRLWTQATDGGAAASAPAVGAVAAADARWAPQAQPALSSQPSRHSASEVPAQWVAAPPAAGSRLLELSPLEESVLTPLFAARPPATTAEMRVEVITDPGTVSRVIVLCASIGGPEAIRQMLGALPANYPALFLVVQHVGDEFMDMLTQQLRRSTPLRVRMVDSGDQVRDGDVIPVPPRQRLVVERDGRVTLHARSEARVGGPSMDQVLRDVSDQFGSACTVVVLSGVAADVADGCRHLASRGGRIYLQTPASCVASSMVEQVQQAGVASFLGTPPELAARLLTDRL